MRLGFFACLLALAAGPAFAQKQVNVYNWSDYIAEDQLKVFTQQTGIKVNYTTYDSNEILDAKLRAGRSGYDVVVPTASPFLVRQLAAKLYQPLDKAKLKNLGNLDPKIMASLAKYDPGNTHAIPWMWGTIGIGYNVPEIRKRMVNAPVNSLAMIFDPAIVSRFVDCGVMMLDSPTDVFPAALKYLQLDPDSKKSEDLEKAAAVIKAIRPFIRKFHSSEYINALAGGDICLAFGYSGDVLQARERAAAAAAAARDRLCHSQPGRDAVDRHRRDSQGCAEPRRGAALPRLHDGAQGRGGLEHGDALCQRQSPGHGAARQVDLAESLDLSVGGRPRPPLHHLRCQRRADPRAHAAVDRDQDRPLD